MLQHAAPEDPLPGMHERFRDGRNVKADRLRLRPGRADAPGLLEVANELRVANRGLVYVADPGHGPIVPRRMYRPPRTRSVTKMRPSSDTRTSLSWMTGCPVGGSC